MDTLPIIEVYSIGDQQSLELIRRVFRARLPRCELVIRDLRRAPVPTHHVDELEPGVPRVVVDGEMVPCSGDGFTDTGVISLALGHPD